MAIMLVFNLFHDSIFHLYFRTEDNKQTDIIKAKTNKDRGLGTLDEKKEKYCNNMENTKNRIIPTVSKDERVGFNYGYHNLPKWLLYSVGLIIVFGIGCWLFCT